MNRRPQRQKVKTIRKEFRDNEPRIKAVKGYQRKPKHGDWDFGFREIK